MMNDIFMEEIVRHKKTGKDYALIALTILAALVLMLIVALFVPVPTPFFYLLLWGVIAYGAVNVIRSRWIEYEYILTNNELDIDRIVAQNYRKHMTTIDIREIELLAPVNSPAHQDAFQNRSALVKTYDFTGNHQTDLYFIDYFDNQRKQRIIFQPRQTMVEAAKKFNPRHVFTE